MSNDLFKEFPPISTTEWEARIAKDLRGEDPASLVWHSPEGIAVKPYYRAEGGAGDIPGKQTPGWLIGEDFDTQDAATANARTIDALNRGVTSIGWKVYGDTDTKALFRDIIFTESDINLVCDESCLRVLDALLEQVGEAEGLLRGSLDYKPLYVGREHEVIHLFRTYRKRLPHFRLLTIHEGEFDTLWASLAGQLTQARAYLDTLTDAGFAAADIFPTMQFEVRLGTDYFFEIARLRALRQLWRVVGEEYGVADASVFIHATNKPAADERDEYYNMIRHTTQAMAAVIGGADSVCITPHQGAEAKADFLHRIARNVQLLLKHESKFDKVADPLAGSWYLESLTKELATQAWKEFVS